MILDPIRPYFNAIKVGVILAALIAAGWYGFGKGKASEAKAHAPAHAKLQQAYDLAHTGLVNAGAALRDVSARTRENAAKAQQQQAVGAEQATRAKAEAEALRDRMSALDRQLKAERSGCHEGEVQICGIPLQ